MELSLPHTIVIVSALVVAFTYLGYNVQKISHFLRPTDFITIAVFAVSGICAFLSFIIGIDLPVYGLVPALSGYIIGYVMADKEAPLYIDYPEPTKNNGMLDYYVLYKIKDKTYIADQSNRAFIRRLLGVHHELITDKQIAAKTQVSVHVPRKRRVYTGEGIYVNEIEENESKKKIWWRLYAKELTTKLYIADASSTNNIDFVKSANVLKRQRREITNLHSQLQKARTEILDKTAERIFEYIFPTDSVLKEEDLNDIVKKEEKAVNPKPRKIFRKDRIKEVRSDGA